MVDVVYLDSVHPFHRLAFLGLMEAYGVKGAQKVSGRKGSKEYTLSSVEGNLAFKVPEALDMNTSLGQATIYDDDLLIAAIRSMPSIEKRRGRDYLMLRRISQQDSSHTVDSDENHKRNIGGSHYKNVVLVSHLENVVTIKNWISKNTNSLDYEFGSRRTPCYIHGILIEGLHFNHDKRNLLTSFTEIVKPTVVEKPKPVGKAKKRVYDEDDDEEDCLKTIEPIAHGYIHVGHFIITTYPNHAAWLKAQSVFLVDMDEEEHLNKWRNIIMGGIVDQKNKASERIEVLLLKLLNEERQLGQLTLLEESARTGTNAAIKRNIEALRAIPELASVTLTDFGFVIITKDMMASRQATGEERYCGQFEIQVGMEGVVRMRNIASPSETYRNPHGTCVGSFGTLFGSALRRFDYNELVLTAMEYYRMVDTSYDHKWKLIPDSKERPAKTYVSEWQELVGDWSNTVDNSLERQLITGYRVIQPDDDDEED